MLHLTALTLSCLAIILGQGSLPVLPAAPNPTLAIVVYIGQFYSPPTGLIMSFILGHFLDHISGGLLGLNSFAMVSLCYISHLLGKRIVVQNKLSQAFLTFAFFMIYCWIVYLLLRFFNIDVAGYAYIKNSLRDGAATAAISPFLVSAIRKMELFFRFEKENGEGSREIKV